MKIYTGQYGSGKSLSMSEELFRLCKREIMLEKKNQGYKRRKILSNLAMNPSFIEWYGGEENYILWKNAIKLPSFKNVIIVWDEITVDMDAHQWELLPHAIKVWLRQIRKLNVTILGTAQSFSELNRSARRRTAHAYYCRSFFSSDTPTDYNPEPKAHGIVWRREISKRSFNKDEDEYIYSDILGDFMFITKKKVDRFSTLQVFEMGEMPSLTHIERKCEECGFRKCIHL